MGIELIKNVYTKPMNKVPRGLTDFGIMRDDIIDFLNSLNIC